MSDRISANAVDAKDLEAPYDKIVKLKQQKKDDVAITMAVGMHPMATVAAAAETVPVKADVTEYIKMLEQISLRVDVGNRLSLEAKKLLKGEEVNYNKLGAIVSQLDTGLREWTTMDKVEPEANMWEPTGWWIWDEYFGGVPKYGLLIIGAPPGVGKTSLVLKLIDYKTRSRKDGRKKIPGKPVAMLSLELPNGILLSRLIETSENLTEDQRKLIRVTDEQYDIDEAVSAITRLVMVNPEVEDIFVDFADLLVPSIGEESTEMAGKIYRNLAGLAKLLRKRIYLISQLNSNYVGGRPRVNHIRWSRLAEAVASMVVLLYNPDQIDVEQGKNSKDNKLPYMPDKAYIILGKSRFGYKHDGRTGAVQVDWLGQKGWGDESAVWFSL